MYQMKANYHTHTPRCQHAVGTEREYIEAAIEARMEVLGFSDHTPQLFPEGYVSTIRMLPEELEDYCDTLVRLREEYRDDIELHIGLEVEYYPELFDALCDYTAQYPIEYFILGQHWIGNEYDQEIVYGQGDDDALLRRYVDQCIAAMETGRFLYLAHPDVFRHSGSAQAYVAEHRRLCEAALRLDVPLEINLLGIANGRHYPDLRFWRIAGEVGNRTILGSDAHRPDNVHRPEVVERALEIARVCGLRLMDRVDLAGC